MRILVAGAGGQLGRELTERGRARRGVTVVGLGRAELDLADGDANAVRRALRRSGADLVINAAAYTQVDRAEDEPERAFAVNRDGVARLAAGCAERGCPLLHVSTDYVFDGRGHRPYREDDPVAPLGVYGASKWAGEQALRDALPRHVIVRTSWVFSARGQNFLTTMLRLGAERERLAVVADQFGRPTYAGSLADALLDLGARVFSSDSAFGTYHYADSPDTSWHGFAAAIFKTARAPLAVRQVDEIETRDYPTRAARPAYSVLDCRRIERRCGIRPRSWQRGLEQCLGV